MHLSRNRVWIQMNTHLIIRLRLFWAEFCVNLSQHSSSHSVSEVSPEKIHETHKIHLVLSTLLRWSNHWSHFNGKHFYRTNLLKFHEQINNKKTPTFNKLLTNWLLYSIAISIQTRCLAASSANCGWFVSYSIGFSAICFRIKTTCFKKQRIQ